MKKQTFHVWDGQSQSVTMSDESNGHAGIHYHEQHADHTWPIFVKDESGLIANITPDGTGGYNIVISEVINLSGK